MPSSYSTNGSRIDGPRPSTPTTTRRRFASTRTRPRAHEGAPTVASSREYLRSGLPGIYQEDDFGLRFVGALETLLDPVVCVLDALPAHFSADLAPPDVLELLAAWLGVELDESWPEERQRELVRSASDLARRRGTRRGLELALQIAMPHLPLRVEDAGTVTYTSQRNSKRESGAPGFVVYCDKPISDEEKAAVAHVIEEQKPVNVSYRLRVKASSRAPKGDG